MGSAPRGRHLAGDGGCAARHRVHRVRRQRGGRGRHGDRRVEVLHYALSFVFLLAGLWAFIRPIDTFFALPSVLGLILVFYGAAEIVQGVASRGQTPYWWASLVSGVLLLLLAVWVSTSDPQSLLARRTYLILFWVGFLAVLRGFTQIMLRLSLRHVGTTAASREPGATGAGDMPPTVPARKRRDMAQSESALPAVPRP